MMSAPSKEVDLEDAISNEATAQWKDPDGEWVLYFEQGEGNIGTTNRGWHKHGG